MLIFVNNFAYKVINKTMLFLSKMCLYLHTYITYFFFFMGVR